MSRRKFWVVIEVIAWYVFFYALLFGTLAGLLVAFVVAAAMSFLLVNELGYSVAYLIHKFQYRGERRNL